ncbi:GrpB family protein [Mycobacterium sp. NPDC004974]
MPASSGAPRSEEKELSASESGPPAWATEPVYLADADPAWALRGEQDRGQLEVLLAPWLIARVEHVGSTSIPGLAAKPIIDLQALVADLVDPQQLVAALQPHGWHYVDPDLDRRPWRRFFVKVTGGRRSAHLHVMTPDSPRWRQQLIFRDALRANPVLVAQYAALKRALASEHSDDREAYSTAKADFVASVLTGAS